MANNLTYTRCGDYYIPNIKLSYTKPIEWNRFSRMACTYLKEQRPILYSLQEIADAVGFKTAGAVSKYIAKIAGSYEDFVSDQYDKFLDEHTT